MSVEELGLGLAAIAAFAIPPARAIGVQIGTASALDGDSLARNLEQRPRPLLVAPGSLAFEDDLEIHEMRVLNGEMLVEIASCRTVVSSASLLRSRVVPDGTATLESTIVEQAVCDLLAEAAPLEPEKVHVVARLAKLGACVMAGSATGDANAPSAKEAAKSEVKAGRITKRFGCRLFFFSGRWIVLQMKQPMVFAFLSL